LTSFRYDSVLLRLRRVSFLQKLYPYDYECFFFCNPPPPPQSRLQSKTPFESLFLLRGCWGVPIFFSCLTVGSLCYVFVAGFEAFFPLPYADPEAFWASLNFTNHVGFHVLERLSLRFLYYPPPLKYPLFFPMRWQWPFFFSSS